MKHTLSVLVENKPGVLSRVAGLFTRRGFNIDSLAVSPTEDPDRSRMTITVDTSRFPVEQMTKQLDKLINVIKIRDLDPENMVAAGARAGEGAGRRPAPAARSSSSSRSSTRGSSTSPPSRSPSRSTGETDELLNFEQLLRPFGLIELVKTGVVALGRGASIT